ncbi:hypothetical protein [Oryzibacter oryziterrae]|nr:hypothetical protein [Oryzibacter oryziterrae]
MAKAQKRGNKENRKPKGEKKAAKVDSTLSSTSALMAKSAPLGGFGKKKA